MILRLLGTPIRALEPKFPFMVALMRSAAYARHAIYAAVVNGNTPEAQERHRGYVRQFYDGEQK